MANGFNSPCRKIGVQLKPASSTVPYFKSGWPGDFDFQRHAWGVSFSSKYYHVIFGNKLFTIEDLKKQFPACSFHRLKQTHSDFLEWASERTTTENPMVGPSKLEGDALASHVANFALGVSTADCIPVVMIDGSTAVGIHAGWKGVDNEIILKTLIELKEKNFDVENAQVFIGPHILRSSFEVDRALGEKFQQSYDQYLKACPVKQRAYFHEVILTPHRNLKEKVFIDLLNLARVQLCIAGIPFESIHFYLQDTKTSPHWASYRREGANMGKNLTFVARRAL